METVQLTVRKILLFCSFVIRHLIEVETVLFCFHKETEINTKSSESIFIYCNGFYDQIIWSNDIK